VGCLGCRENERVTTFQFPGEGMALRNMAQNRFLVPGVLSQMEVWVCRGLVFWGADCLHSPSRTTSEMFVDSMYRLALPVPICRTRVVCDGPYLVNHQRTENETQRMGWNAVQMCFCGL
jgi:hypothetical protein